MLDPETRFGEPCIIETQIAVTDILRLYNVPYAK